MSALRSFKMIAARPGGVRIMALWAALLTALGILSRFIQSDFLRGFLFAQCQIMPTVLVIVIMQNVWNANNPQAPGYKFFHSTAGSASHFRRAVLAANALSLVFAEAFAAVSLVYLDGYAAALCGIMPLFGLGYMNFVGHFKSVWTKMIPLFVLGALCGVFSGFFDEGNTPPPLLIPIIAISAIVIYAASLAFVLMNSQKFWHKEA